MLTSHRSNSRVRFANYRLERRKKNRARDPRKSKPPGAEGQEHCERSEPSQRDLLSRLAETADDFPDDGLRESVPDARDVIRLHRLRRRPA